MSAARTDQGDGDAVPVLDRVGSVSALKAVEVVRTDRHTEGGMTPINTSTR
jgi:hypothetical protein